MIREVKYCAHGYFSIKCVFFLIQKMQLFLLSFLIKIKHMKKVYSLANIRTNLFYISWILFCSLVTYFNKIMNRYCFLCSSCCRLILLLVRVIKLAFWFLSINLERKRKKKSIKVSLISNHLKYTFSYINANNTSREKKYYNYFNENIYSLDEIICFYNYDNSFKLTVNTNNNNRVIK